MFAPCTSETAVELCKTALCKCSVNVLFKIILGANSRQTVTRKLFAQCRLHPKACIVVIETKLDTYRSVEQVLKYLTKKYSLGETSLLFNVKIMNAGHRQKNSKNVCLLPALVKQNIYQSKYLSILLTKYFLIRKCLLFIFSSSFSYEKA